MQQVTKTVTVTGTYNAVIDQEGEMQLALANMQINDSMDLEWISNYESILSEGRVFCCRFKPSFRNGRLFNQSRSSQRN